MCYLSLSIGPGEPKVLFRWALDRHARVELGVEDHPQGTARPHDDAAVTAFEVVEAQLAAALLLPATAATGSLCMARQTEPNS